MYMTIKIKLIGKSYNIKVLGNNGKLLYTTNCCLRNLEQTIDDITAEFSEIII